MKFLKTQQILILHERTINQHGGSHGLRDSGALESALAAAENRYHYENADLVMCAATYAYHLSQAHAFIDGNKRIASLAADAFLGLNNARLVAPDDEEIIKLFLQIASGEMTRDEVETKFAEWFVEDKKS